MVLSCGMDIHMRSIVMVRTNRTLQTSISNTYRDLQNNQPLRESLANAQRLEHHDSHGRKRQQKTHFDIETRGVEEAAQMPIGRLVTVNGGKQAKHRKTVIEAPQQENAV